MRNKYSTANDVHSHGKGSPDPGNKTSPTVPVKGTAINLKRPLPDDVASASSQRKKRAIKSIAKNATLESEQSVHLSKTHECSRQDGVSGSGSQPPPLGRLKSSLQNLPRNIDAISPSAPNEAKNATVNVKASETAGEHAILNIPSEVRHLTTKYDLTPMSIISSSKMEQKIRNVLERVSKFSFGDAKAKPGVVILHAEAKNASKMVTIAELSKANIEKDKGTWWQYTKLEGQVMAFKEKPRKPPPTQSGRTLATWNNERKDATAVGPQADINMEESHAEPSTEEQPIDAGGGLMPEGEEEEEEEAFEIMSAPTARKKVRAVPIMTIYLARVPVPGLRELYG